jgi:MEMO1 family protein
MNGIAEVRPSPIVGRWYHGKADLLRQEVDHYLDSAQLPQLDGEVRAVVAPHAGHRYSGRTAGHAFAAVRGQRPDLVAVVSPMHYDHPADLLISAHKAYSTPLGPVWIDLDAQNHLDDLLRQEGLNMERLAYDDEHSLEIELPFLQRTLASDFRLLPVMVRRQSPKAAQELGRALAQVLRGKNALLVASTDLSHFYPEQQAKQLDEEMLRGMARFQPDALFAVERAGKGYACGVGAVAAVLWAAKDLGANRVEILHYSTSGDETGDWKSVVGYGAAAVLAQKAGAGAGKA